MRRWNKEKIKAWYWKSRSDVILRLVEFFMFILLNQKNFGNTMNKNKKDFFQC